MITALLRYYFFRFLILFSIVFLHLWLQSMLERQVLRRPVDPCYTADDRPDDNPRGNRAGKSDYDVNHYVVVAVASPRGGHVHHTFARVYLIKY